MNFQIMISLNFIVAPQNKKQKNKQKETFCNIYSSIKLCFDQRFGYISFAGSYCCALWVHTKLLNFVFLGKYCNSGLSYPVKLLEPEVTLSQSYNVKRMSSCLFLAVFMAGTYLYTLLFRSIRTFRYSYFYSLKSLLTLEK